MPQKGHPGQETRAKDLPCLRCGHAAMVCVDVPDAGGRVAVRMGWWLAEDGRRPTPLWPWTWLRLTTRAYPAGDRALAIIAGTLATGGFLALVATLDDASAATLVWGAVGLVVLGGLAGLLRRRRQ